MTRLAIDKTNEQTGSKQTALELECTGCIRLSQEGPRVVPALTALDPRKNFCLATDASEMAVGSCLSQTVDGIE